MTPPVVLKVPFVSSVCLYPSMHVSRGRIIYTKWCLLSVLYISVQYGNWSTKA